MVVLIVTGAVPKRYLIKFVDFIVSWGSRATAFFVHLLEQSEAYEQVADQVLGNHGLPWWFVICSLQYR